MRQKLLLVVIAILGATLAAVSFPAQAKIPPHGPPCVACPPPPTLAPGHEATFPGGAQNFAPGHEIGPGPTQRQHDGASDFAPGIEAKCTPGSPCP